MTRPIYLILPMLMLLVAAVAAQDTNTTTMTPEELQLYIESLQGAVEEAQRVQPQIITIQVDEELNKKLEIMQAQMIEVTRTNKKLEERFAALSTQMEERMQSNKQETVTLMKEDTAEKFAGFQKEMKSFIHTATNPVRMNLPSIGMFAILSAIFLLWISRTYTPKGAS